MDILTNPLTYNLDIEGNQNKNILRVKTWPVITLNQNDHIWDNDAFIGNLES